PWLQNQISYNLALMAQLLEASAPFLTEDLLVRQSLEGQHYQIVMALIGDLLLQQLLVRTPATASVPIEQQFRKQLKELHQLVRRWSEREMAILKESKTGN
ncbi:MAG: hypothetical protein WCG27_03910, partial [Pseudomonadota bacterium]